jgi:hypothetical protein
MRLSATHLSAGAGRGRRRRLWTIADAPSEYVNLWLDIADSSTVTLNGTDLVNVNDKSGMGLHFSQPTASNQPGFVLNAQNGLPNILQKGASVISRLNPVGLFVNSTGATWIAAARYPVAPVTSNAMLCFCSTGAVVSATRIGLTANSQQSGLSDRHSVAGRRLDEDGFQSVASSTPRIQDAFFIEIGHINYSAGQASHWINGVNDLSGVPFQTAGVTSDTTGLVASIFNSHTGGNIAVPTGTRLGEAIALRGQLSADLRQRIEGYLAHKWGTASTLPANHPYKTTPPMV